MMEKVLSDQTDNDTGIVIGGCDRTRRLAESTRALHLNREDCSQLAPKRILPTLSVRLGFEILGLGRVQPHQHTRFRANAEAILFGRRDKASGNSFQLYSTQSRPNRLKVCGSNQSLPERKTT